MTQIHSHTGSHSVESVEEEDIPDLLASGDIVFHKKSGQYRWAVSAAAEVVKPSLSSASTITFYETECYVGLHGPHKQRIAKAKIDNWNTVFDKKAVCVSGGIARRPIAESAVGCKKASR